MIVRNEKHSRRAALVVVFALAACLLLPGDGAQAAPENPTVRHGEASFENNGSHTNITAGNNAVIDYGSFNIAPNESVRFIQPSERARVLNRITGSGPSHIEGALTANGHVYLVNPAGVYFAGTAQIDVAGLHAAAGHMSVSDFVNGIDRFTDLSGEVVNAGDITADNVSLVGRQVTNTGNINAGNVLALVAGNDVYLFERGGRISVQVDGSNLGEATGGGTGENTREGVTNDGTLSAGRQITLGAGDMYSLAIRNRGKITAAGGEIQVLANDGNISLADGSSISAAGEGGGDGGDVVVNAVDGVTFFAKDSLIDVSGGPAGGDGGFVEISGKLVDFHGSVKTDGENQGTLLIDPYDIYIEEPGDDDGEIADGEILYDEPNIIDDVNISPSALEALSGNIFIQAWNSIFVEEEVNLVNNNDVTLEALFNDIVFNARFLGARDLTVQAGATGEIIFNVASAGPGDPVVQTSGPQKYFSPVVLKQDTMLETATGGGIDFQQTVQKDPAAASARLGMDTSGVTFASDVGGADNTTALTGIHLWGTANIGSKTGTGPDVTIRTTGEQEYDGNVNLYSNSHLITTDSFDGWIRFYGEIDNFRQAVALGKEANLLIDTAAGVQFDAFVSERTLVGSLWVNGETYMNGGRIATARDQIYNGPVYLMTDSLCVSTRGDIRFLGPVGSAQLQAQPRTTQYRLPGLIVHAEKVNPFFNPGEFDDPVADMRNGDVQFAGDIGIDWLDNGVEAATRGDSLSTAPGGAIGYLYVFSAVNNDNPAVPGDLERGVITFGGNEIPADEINVNVVGDIRLNSGGNQLASPRVWNHETGYANDLTSVPTIATIASADGDVVFNAGDDFIMGGTAAGANKLTSVGKLTINAGDTAVLGDLNAYISTVDPNDPVSISVNAAGFTTTYLLNRPANGVRMPDNSVIDDLGIDIVCQRMFEFIGTAEESDPSLGGPPRFGTPVLDPDVTGVIEGKGWQILENINLTPADFLVPYFYSEGPLASDPNAPLDAGRAIVLDLTIIQPTPPGDGPGGDILLAPLPWQDRIVREPLLGPDQRALAGQALGMGTRDLTQGEFAEFNPGRQRYSDFAPTFVADDDMVRTVALNRVRRSNALQALEQYEAMFLARETDPETGETRMVDRSGQLQQPISNAWSAYQSQAGDATGFAEWLAQSDEHAEAREIMAKLRTMLRQLDNVGLSSVEYNQVVRQVLRPITPEGVTVEQFRSAITGEQPVSPTAERDELTPVG
ncbi:MAG: filamentous hemagglutinin N-terminal domain-containing protein [Phycisphaerae bacterium]